MSKPTTRQLMLAVCLGIRISPRMDREQVSQLIDDAHSTAGSESPNKRQLQLGEYWECSVKKYATRKAASHRLWKHWEKRFNSGELLPLPEDAREQLGAASGDPFPMIDPKARVTVTVADALPHKESRLKIVSAFLRNFAATVCRWFIALSLWIKKWLVRSARFSLVGLKAGIRNGDALLIKISGGDAILLWVWRCFIVALILGAVLLVTTF